MKKIGYLISGTGAMALTPLLALAAFTDATGGASTGIGHLVTNITDFINSYLIPGVMALAFLAFIWGMFKYFIAGGGNDEEKEKGKQLMIWATVGFVMIVIIWGLVNLLGNSLGLSGDHLVIPPSPS